jgi:hypothetical protein
VLDCFAQKVKKKKPVCLLRDIKEFIQVDGKIISGV